MIRALLTLSLLLAAAPAWAAGTLRVGMQDDPDILDPARGGTFAGRIVFASLCDKLVDLDGKMNFVPQLATAWSWAPDGRALTMTLRDGVTFQDGTPMDAEAVRASLERARTAQESVRKTELKPVSAIEVVDPHTIRLVLSQPYSPLVAVLADRAGMIVSPKAVAEKGAQFGTAPVCAGPFSFVSRVAQGPITLQKFPGYWNAGAISFDREVFTPVPDTTVRLNDLRAGQFDIIERLGATDVATVKSDQHLRLVTQPAVAYRTLAINIANGAGAKGPLAQDARLRAAFEKSIDRDAINQVVMNGLFVPNNQTELPNSRYWDASHPVPPRDVEGAKALMREAGQPHPTVTLVTENTPTEVQVGQVIQSMASEAGFDVKLQSLETNTMVAGNIRGDFQVSLVLWSGRADPDFNISIFLACDGFQNWGKYCSPQFDGLLNQARSTTDVTQRQALYRQVVDRYLADKPDIFLYNLTWLFALSDKLDGFTPVPDGLIRPTGMRFR
jgi:peptide/nickel transport system substrate-binding protein